MVIAKSLQCKRRIGAIAYSYVLALLLILASIEPSVAETERFDAPKAPQPETLIETPALEDAVAKGALPSVRDRLPDQPAVFVPDDDRQLGTPGGELRMLVGRAKDTRLLTVYGYARLIGYDEDLNLVSDILESVEVEDGRSFTLKLRRGHKWSDGQPFTTDDFLFFWQDVALNEELSPVGPPKDMLVDDEFPSVEAIDEVTVRYTWSKPNPFFLDALAGALPLYIYAPKHYLQQFHADYQDADTLERLIKDNNARNWVALFKRKGRQYRNDNPDLPTLQPWVNTIAPPSQRFVAERNAYFHRIDAAGRQLPYIDSIILNVAGSSLIPAKTAAGDSQLQSRGLAFSDYTFLKDSEERSQYRVLLWPTVRGSQIAIYPNLNANDETWRTLFRDVRFRRALSLATDRYELNQAIYFGLGLEGNQSVLPGSSLYNPLYRKAYAEFSIDKANALLDEIGLTERNSNGIRLLPDGRPMDIIIETAGENTEEVDLLELIHDSWLKVGIKLYSKPSQREVLRARIFSGEAIMSMWYGYENSVPTPDMSPAEFAPVRQHSYHWPKWGQHHETSGEAGVAVDMEAPKELMALYEEWRAARTRGQRQDVWRRILEIHAEQVYTLGLVAQIPQPIVVADSLRNVPEDAMYNWDPGAEFGIYRPDTFWFEP